MAALITTAELSAYVGRDLDDTGAELAVDGASQTCRTVAEQDFSAATTTVALDGTGTDALVLPQRPVTRIRSVTVAGTAVTDFAVSDAGILYRTPFTAAAGSFASTSVWPVGRQNVVVEYEHGWRGAAVPADVKMVALALAARLILQGPALQESNGDVSVRYGVNSTDLTNGELRILTKYRRVRS